MIATPPLRRRVVASGVAVVAVVLLVVNVALQLAYGASLRDSLSQLLEERGRTVQVDAAAARGEGAGLEELARRLQVRGIRAVLRSQEGVEYGADPDSPAVGGLPTTGDDSVVSRTVPLDAGATAKVFARSGVRGSLQRLAVLQVLTSLGALGLAALLLSGAARRALRPVNEMVQAAGRTSSGARGERLQPDRPETELGRLAFAYDAVLDALEVGYEVAAGLERRSGAMETRWRQVLEAAEEAYVCVDAHGLVVDWNARAEQVFGWSRDEALSQPATRLVGERHRVAFVAKVAELTSPGPLPSSAPFAVDGVRKDGTAFPAECIVWGVDRRGGTVVHAFVRDVSVRRKAEDAAARLVAVVEGSSDAIVTTRLDGVVLTWNAAAERIFGWSAQEAAGQHVSLIVPPTESARLAEALQRVGRGERTAGWDAEWTARGGVNLPVSTAISPVHDRHGSVVAASSITRDVTEQRWMAETLDRTLAALQEALAEARASEETTRRFLADAAHQLRTPMAGIRACAETLLRGADPDDADRLLATMVRETSRAARLITALLRIARLEQGELGAPIVPVDVVPLCAAEVERLTLLSPDLEVRLVIEQAPTGPVQLDAAATQEILSNLGDNARRHAAARIQLVVDAGDECVSLRMVDDGPGVPAELREEVFERFVSLDGRGGSGLGLSIARGLARAMDGDLRYEDGFLLELPAQNATISAVSST